MGALYLEHPLGRKLTVGESRGKKLACATLKQFTRCLLDFRASVSFPFFFFFNFTAENISILLTRESGAYSAVVEIH